LSSLLKFQLQYIKILLTRFDWTS